MENRRVIEELLERTADVEERMVIILPKERGERLIRLAKENGIIIETIDSESPRETLERELLQKNRELGDRIKEQEEQYLRSLTEQLVEEEKQRQMDSPDPNERARRKDMKRQQYLARRYSSKFKK